MKSVQANNPYLIEIFERNTEEWINCLTADEAAKQKLAIVVEHAGKLSSNWGLQRRFRQLSSSNRVLLASFLDCFRAILVCSLVTGGLVCKSHLLISMRE